MFSEKFNQTPEKVNLRHSWVRFQSFSNSASLVRERLKSYPRVSEISLSCTLPGVRFYISTKTYPTIICLSRICPCNMKQKYKMLLWSIPKWDFVFINEDVVRFQRWRRHGSRTDKSTSCITYKILYWVGCIEWLKSCIPIEYILNVS